MGLMNILNSLTIFDKKRLVDLEKLPSMGMFYPDDFSIHIKKATLKDIELYKKEYDNNSILLLRKIQTVVKNNTVIKGGYSYRDIRAIDVLYVFFMIVSYTIDDKEILVNMWNVKIDILKNYGYFKIPGSILPMYDMENKYIEIKDWKFSLPSIGTEKSVTEFLLIKGLLGKAERYGDKNWNFMYFVNGKNILSDKEIENLLIIFGEDMGKNDLEMTDMIVKSLSGFLKYSVRYNGLNYSIENNIDLKNIWS